MNTIKNGGKSGNIHLILVDLHISLTLLNLFLKIFIYNPDLTLKTTSKLSRILSHRPRSTTNLKNYDQ